MFSDFGTILYWWLFIFGIGLIFLPLTKKIFPNFFDKGYLFSKVLGIMFSSYFVWLLSSLKILPFYKETIWLVLIIGLIINLVISRKSSRLASTEVSAKSRRAPPLLIYILEELMFLITLAFWSFIRGFQPDIQGLEKFMDFGFVNSILRSKYFPPADMWFAGKSINYYYFGHYVTAFLTKLSGIDSAITYNLMIATLFAFCFSLTFSLTGNLIYFSLFKNFENLKIVFRQAQDGERSRTNFKLKIKNFKLIILGGLIAAFLISLGANLHPAYYNLKMGLFNKPYCDGAKTYWYPNATRYIGYCPEVEDKTIHEFPSYSFIVSDLHGHVSDIPFVLTFLAGTLVLLLKIKDHPDSSFLQLLSSIFYLPLLLSVFFMTNQWDFPIYLMVLGLVLLWSYYQHYGWTTKTLVKSVSLGMGIILLSIPFFLAFQLKFDPIVNGIAFVNAHSLAYQLLIMWGVPWFFGLTFLVFLFGRYIKPKQVFKKENLVKWFSKTLGVDIEFKKVSSRISNSSFSLLTSHFSPDYFVLILFLVSTILIIIPEIIYVKDIYIASYHRANTMFKLTYQSFMMFSICIGYVFVRVISSLKKGFTRKVIFIFYLLFFISLMVYPNYTIPGYYGKLQSKNYKGLYGLNFINRLYSDDYNLIIWLNKNISGQPVVLEAVGDSYTDYERISMATGLPTIEGWLVHEWLWRGSYDEPGKRAEEVRIIYESQDVSQTKSLLDQYHVKYIVIGEMERQKYSNLNEEKIKSLGKEVFKSGKTVLYELN